jgi:hypothetical protein
METETKYILAGVVFLMWIVIRIWLMKRRSARIRQLREQAPEASEHREADAAEDGKAK